MVHHNGYLARIGKEDNTFIKFGGPNLTPDHKKLSVLNKQCLVWYARKWHNKGLWPDETKRCNCYVRTNTFSNIETSIKPFVDKFVLTEEEQSRTVKRFETIYNDAAIKAAVKQSKAFTKDPIGDFSVKQGFGGGPLIKNNTAIQTHIHCDLKYWDDLLWKIKAVY